MKEIYVEMMKDLVKILKIGGGCIYSEGEINKIRDENSSE